MSFFSFVAFLFAWALAQVAPLAVAFEAASSTADDAVFLQRRSQDYDTRRGLLRGVDPRTAEYFSSNISMTCEDLAWLKEPGIFWDAAQNDARLQNVAVEAYLAKIRSNFLAFFGSGTVYDREGFQRAVTDILESEGKLALISGGKSIGKSLVLENLRDRYNHGDNEGAGYFVLYIDGRIHRNKLAEGLFAELAVLQMDLLITTSLTKQTRKKLLYYFVDLFREKASERARATLDDFITAKRFSNDIKDEVFKAIERISGNLFGTKSEASQAERVIQGFINFARERNRYPVVVLDEVNELLGDSTLETRTFLVQCVQATKQHRAMNLILVTSDHGFRFKLQRAGFNLHELTGIVLVGDLSPKKTWDFLVHPPSNTSTLDFSPVNQTIGMGPHLAELSLAAYGGHLLHISYAVEALSKAKARFFAQMNLPGISANILKCLKNSSQARPLLLAMAKHGFDTVETYDDKTIEAIVEQNIGGIFPLQLSFAEHIPFSIWENARGEYALVPSYNAVRLAVAGVLARIDPEEFEINSSF